MQAYQAPAEALFLPWSGERSIAGSAFSTRTIR